jgi:hypothetical protein
VYLESIERSHLFSQEGAMTGKHLVILAAAGLVWSVSAAHAAMDGISRLKSVSSIKADNANDEALSGAEKQKNLLRQTKQKKVKRGTTFCPPPCQGVAEKKKGKGGKKGGEAQQYMIIKMEDAMISSYRSSQGGRPKGPPSGGLLDSAGGGFNPNAPSATGTPLAPAAGGGGQVIK